MPCEYSGPTAWQLLQSTSPSSQSSLRSSCIRRKLMVGLRDGRRSKRLQAVIRRGIRSGLCEQHHKTVEELVEEADDKLFTNVTYNKQHVLHSTLPGTMDTKYHLRPRPIILSSPLRIARLLNVILLPGCFLKTFIAIFDIMFSSLLSYVLTFLFNMYCLLFTVISSRLTSCN